MRRRRGELLGLVVIVAVLAVIAGISLLGGSSPASTTAPSARPAANAFARSYLSYLAGRSDIATLPYLTAQARAQAAAGGRVPAPYRRQLSLRKFAFTGVLGARRASAGLTASAGSHVLQAAVALTYTNGSWQVSSLVPPDFPTVFSPPPPPPKDVPPAAAAAARAFAVAYSNYRTGAARALPSGLSAIRRQIASRQDPLATTTPNRAPAHLLKLSMLPQGTLSVVDAVTAAAGDRLSFSFILQQTGGHWQASQFPVSAQ
jgi:Tfp pilus assembly protein FimT